MRETLYITQFKNSVLTTLKCIFNMEKKAMSTVLVKVEKTKSPFEHMSRK